MSNFPIQGPPKFIQIGNFWYENKPSGNPVFGTEKKATTSLQRIFLSKGGNYKCWKTTKANFFEFSFLWDEEGVGIEVKRWFLLIFSSVFLVRFSSCATFCRTNFERRSFNLFRVNYCIF
jgi:hypothetical protein